MRSLKIKINSKIIIIPILMLIVLIFWNFAEINSRIYGEANSNLKKYYIKYNNFSEEVELGGFNEYYYKDYGYFILTKFLKDIGISFNYFLFSSFFLFLGICCKVFNKLSSYKSWIPYFFLILLACLVMNSLLGNTVRQGIAVLLLIYFLLYCNSSSIKLNLLYILIAASFHLSALIFLPFVFFCKPGSINLKILDCMFFITFLFYILDLTAYISNLIYEYSIYLNLDLRALNINSTYKVGFTINKAIGILVPVIFFKFLSSRKDYLNFLYKKIYLFYCLPIIAGMCMSGLAYYDRVLLYGWSISSIMIVYGTFNFLIILKKKNLK